MGIVGLTVTVVIAAGPPASQRAPTAAPAAKDEAARASSSTAEQVRSIVEEHVARAVRESGGTYRLVDELTGETVDLNFVEVALVAAGSLWRVHDPGRPGLERRAYFACVNFEPVSGPREKHYDVDVLVELEADGLVVTDVWIHKVKRLEKGEWVWEERKARPSRADAPAPAPER